MVLIAKPLPRKKKPTTSRSMFTIVENILAERGVIFAKNNCGTGYATEGEVVWELEIVYTDCHDGDTECHYQKIFLSV